MYLKHIFYVRFTTTNLCNYSMFQKSRYVVVYTEFYQLRMDLIFRKVHLAQESFTLFFVRKCFIKKQKLAQKKDGLLLCHSHIDLRLRFRLSWRWYWDWGWFVVGLMVGWDDVESKFSWNWVEVGVGEGFETVLGYTHVVEQLLFLCFFQFWPLILT